MFIKNYIEKHLTELKDRLYPVFTTDVSGLSVVYRFTPISGGTAKEYQLELKVISVDFDESQKVANDLIGLLDMPDDTSYVRCEDGYFHSTLAGGGWLYNEGPQMFENTVIFIVDWR